MKARWPEMALSVLFALAVGCASKSRPGDADIVSSFNRYYLDGVGASGRIHDNRFLGVQTLQTPTDMWMLQEILVEVRPDLVIETGTYKGGSALYFALLLEQINPEAKVITIDRNALLDGTVADLPEPIRAQVKALAQRRIEFIQSNSVAPELIAQLAARAKDKRVLVALDSCHAVEHVARELELYSPLVSKGSYLVVNDTRHDDDPKWLKKWAGCSGYERAGGPGLAVDEFLQSHSDFQADRDRERFLLTWYPRGYLRRVR